MSNGPDASDLTRPAHGEAAAQPAGVPEPRPLRTFATYQWKDTPEPTRAPVEPEPLPPVEIDPVTGAPKPRPLRTFAQVVWKR